MARVTSGVTTRRRHKRVLQLTAGQRASKHLLYRRAHEAMLKALSYAYRDRRDRKGFFRRLWTARINAAARQQGLTYSRFMEGLHKAGIALDRKILADLALRDPARFSHLIMAARQTLAP